MGVNAQTSVPLFTAGEVLTAANQNISAGTGVPVFATTTTRDAAFGGTGEKVLAEGQMCYIEAAPNRLQIYDGATWRPIDLDNWTAFTPTITAATGSLTTASGTAAHMTIGKLCTVRFSISITTNGTGATAVVMSLPFNQAAGYGNNQAIGVAREGAITGNLCQVAAGSTGSAVILDYKNSYPGANGVVIAGTYAYEVSA
jgi:hypothetical protein